MTTPPPNDLVRQLIQSIHDLLDYISQAREKAEPTLAQIHPEYRQSAENLVHYCAMRSRDLREVQKQLRQLGLSRLANSQGHILWSLHQTLSLLYRLDGCRPYTNPIRTGISTSEERLRVHTQSLLGTPPIDRRVRMMVTVPETSANQPHWAAQMAKAGMDVARINCAHDDPEVWHKMVRHIRQAAQSEGREIKIAMDLGGPKIRTGDIAPGPRVRKFAPQRNELGKVVSPAQVRLVADTQPPPDDAIPVPQAWLAALKPGMRIRLRDARSKKRTLKITAAWQTEAIAITRETTYFLTGTLLKTETQSVRVGLLPPLPQAILLREGDQIWIHDRPELPAQPVRRLPDGSQGEAAHIGCTLPEIFDAVKPGQPILFDDGKIGGKIEQVGERRFLVRITQAAAQGSKLKSGKGINLPRTRLPISGLTPKDRQDLAFIAQNADIVNFSFVNSAKDVEELLEAMEQLGVRNQLSIILKIETQQAFDHLYDILMAAMRIPSVGVMIARGDLAIETGWPNIGWVQKEILLMCSAARIPVVWATQVLETLAKKGIPSRSEITDVATSIKSECVMLNKGPYILQAISLLRQILVDMELFDEKHERMMPKLSRLLED